jgi:hypothetical protein
MAKRVTIFEPKGDPDRLLENKRTHIDPVMERKGPEYGLISHVTARTPDGLMVINLWESEEASERAFQDPEVQDARRQAAEANEGGEPPSSNHYEVVDYRG